MNCGTDDFFANNATDFLLQIKGSSAYYEECCLKRMIYETLQYYHMAQLWKQAGTIVA